MSKEEIKKFKEYIDFEYKMAGLPATKEDIIELLKKAPDVAWNSSHWKDDDYSSCDFRSKCKGCDKLHYHKRMTEIMFFGHVCSNCVYWLVNICLGAKK